MFVRIGQKLINLNHIAAIDLEASENCYIENQNRLVSTVHITLAVPPTEPRSGFLRQTYSFYGEAAENLRAFFVGINGEHFEGKVDLWIDGSNGVYTICETEPRIEDAAREVMAIMEGFAS